MLSKNKRFKKTANFQIPNRQKKNYENEKKFFLNTENEKRIF